MIAAITTLVVPIAVRRMIDFGFSRDSVSLIDNYFTVLIVVVAVLALASAARFYLVTMLGERIVADLRSEVFGHLTSLSASYFDQAKTGEAISRLTADTTQIKAAVGSAVSVALRNLVMFVGAGAMMVITSPRLSAFVLAAIPIIVLPLYGFGRAVRARSRAAQDTLAAASAYASELIGAVRVLQAFTNETMARRRFAAAVERAFEAAVSSTRARAVLTAIAIFLVFAQRRRRAVGRRAGRAGRTDHRGPAVAVRALCGVRRRRARVSCRRSGASFRKPPAPPSGCSKSCTSRPAIVAPAHPAPLPQPARGEVTFSDVRFAYPSRPSSLILDGVSLRVRRGEKVALVGPSGAGKSTIFHLILRFYDPQSGTVSFDGVPLPAADPAALRREIALVPQDTVDLRCLDRRQHSFRQAGGERRRCGTRRRTGACLRVHRPPAGEVCTPQAGERGVTLSGGQRQRIAIARAILRDAPLLLLDEATSSLDAESEKLVQTALERLMRDRTTLVIAHRLATVLSCDRILVMDGGRIVEEGTHGELARGGGLYARLAKLQLQGS